MKYNDLDAAVYAPSSDPRAGDRGPIRLAGTGATEVSTGELSIGIIYELRVGAEPVRIAFSGLENPTLSGTEMIVGAYQAYRWKATVLKDGSNNVVHGTTYLSVEAADGASAYEAHVYKRSR